jgi:hypothetical protein
VCPSIYTRGEVMRAAQSTVSVIPWIKPPLIGGIGCSNVQDSMHGGKLKAMES